MGILIIPSRYLTAKGRIAIKKIGYAQLEQELMEVRQTLESRLKEYRQRGTLLDRDTLAYIAPYESRLGLKGELVALVEKSKREAAAKRRRLIAFGLATATTILVVVFGLGIVSYLNYLEAKAQTAIAESKTREAAEQLIQANHHLGLALNEKAEIAAREKNFNAARLYSLYALARLKPEAVEEQAAARGRMLSYPSYPVIFSVPGSSISFSPDGALLATGSLDGTVRLWAVATAKPLATLQGHTAAVWSVSGAASG